MKTKPEPETLSAKTIAILLAAVFSMFLIAWNKHYDRHVLNTYFKKEIQSEQFQGFVETLSATPLMQYEKESLNDAKAWFAAEWDQVTFRNQEQALRAGRQLAADYMREVKQDELQAGFIFASAYFSNNLN